MLVNGEHPSRPQHAKQFAQAGLWFRNLAEHCDENRDIETLVVVRQRFVSVMHCEPDVSLSARVQFALCLRDHFGLQFEQLKPGPHDPPC